MQQPALSGNHEVNNIVNAVSQPGLSSSSFTKLPTLKVKPPFLLENRLTILALLRPLMF